MPGTEPLSAPDFPAPYHTPRYPGRRRALPSTRRCGGDPSREKIYRHPHHFWSPLQHSKIDPATPKRCQQLVSANFLSILSYKYLAAGRGLTGGFREPGVPRGPCSRRGPALRLTASTYWQKLEIHFQKVAPDLSQGLVPVLQRAALVSSASSKPQVQESQLTAELCMRGCCI